MSYRTLEEKFLADYEALEKENMALQGKVQELLEKLAAQKGNHVLECSACGETCEHVNGSYPRCPHCGRKAVEHG